MCVFAVNFALEGLSIIPRWKGASRGKLLAVSFDVEFGW